MSTRVLGLAASLVLLAACASTGPRGAAPKPLAADTLAGVAPSGATPVVADRWWSAFGDPQLDALIDEGLANSPTVAAAIARLSGADALARAARGGRLPSTSLDASVERQRLSEKGLYPPPYGGMTLNLGQVGLDFSYEIDLVGRVKNTIAASEAGSAAARGDLAAAWLGLEAGIARTYLKLNRNYALEDTLTAAAARRRDLLALTEQRVRAGLDTQLEIEEARATLAAAEADLASAAEDRALLSNELAALVGQGPGRGSSLTRPTTTTPRAVAMPQEIPANLVARRPDVAADRARVESAAAQVRVARAAFYPNINLSAFAGFQSIALGSLISDGTRAWNAGPAISLPLFFTDKLRGQLGARDADYAGAVAKYNGTVIDAFHEVADAVASLKYLDREQAANKDAIAALDHAYQLALERYRAGLANYLTVLIAEENLLAQRRVGVDLDARRADLAVALFRALGGGFTA